jgi:hypothetical protein
MNNIIPLKKQSLILFSLLILANLSLFSQISVENENPVVISFNSFNGSGFSPEPSAGDQVQAVWVPVVVMLLILVPEILP